MFPRSRWTGMDEAQDWVGVLSNIHNMLPSVYQLWYAHVTGRPPPPPASAAHVSGPSDFSMIMDETSDQGFVSAFGASGDAAPSGNVQPSDPTEASAASTSPDENWKTNTIALKFVSTPSLPSTVPGLRMIDTPVFDMMHASLDVGGSKWDKLQFAKRANGEPRESTRGTVAATCKLEGLAMQGLKDVAFDESKWGIIFPQHHTVSFRNAQFQLLITFA